MSIVRDPSSEDPVSARAEPNGALVETRGLVREYQVGPTKVRALSGVDLAVHRGEILGVLGVSGSGKSTLLHLLGGLDTPSAGSVLVEGRDLAAYSPYQRALYRRTTVGFVFQTYYLVPSLTAVENVGMALTFQGMFGPEARQLAEAALRRVRLESRAGHRPSQLSGGEQQRVALARAIVRRPPLLLADEPTGNLDRTTATEVMTLVQEIHAELGTTIVMVTHDQEMAVRVSNRTVRLRDGQLLEGVGGDCPDFRGAGGPVA